MERTIIEQAEQLLQSTKIVLAKQEEIARLKGENFNIFRVLGIEHREDELHSRFIAELLDPNGSHDQGTVFLKMFLEQVVDPLPPDSFPKECKARPDENKAKVSREHPIGDVEIAGDESTGGRIDIFITDDTRHISIENKIYASEGEHQVTRYCNYKPDRNLVLFLTMRGEEADTKKPYHPISYQDHILPWLESCQKHCADLPILRETIKQYIITVKGLTGGKKMDENLKQLMQENIEATHAIYLNYESCVRSLVEEKVFQKLIEKIMDEESAFSSFKCLTWPDIWTGFTLEKNEYRLRWEIDKSNRTIYGISDIQGKLDGIERYGVVGVQNNSYYTFRGSIEEADFRDLNNVKKLLNEEERAKLVEDIADKLIALMKFCDDRLIPEDSR